MINKHRSELSIPHLTINNVLTILYHAIFIVWQHCIPIQILIDIHADMTEHYN